MAMGGREARFHGVLTCVAASGELRSNNLQALGRGLGGWVWSAEGGNLKLG